MKKITALAHSQSLRSLPLPLLPAGVHCDWLVPERNPDILPGKEGRRQTEREEENTEKYSG